MIRGRNKRTQYIVMRKVCLIFTVIIIFIPSIIFSQSIDCKEARNECLKQAEDNYNWATASCMISEPFYEEYCRSIEDTSLLCVDNQMKRCKKEALEEYQQSTEACNKSYKNCRKGDIFGVITFDIQYDTSKGSEEDSSEYWVGKAYVMISGFWKYQPKESLVHPKEYVKNYKPDGVWLHATFEEAYMTKYPDEQCPIKLLEYYEGGGGRLLTVDKNVDIPMNPLGRFVKFELPEPLPSMWKYAERAKSLHPKYKKQFPPDFDMKDEDIEEAKEELKKFGSLKFYEVGHIGVEIPIKGKELDEEKCKYKPSTLHVRFGKFLLVDDIKIGGAMQGSKSWEIWGIISELGRDDRTITFELDNKTGEFMTPDKCDSKCAGRINVRWRFQEIK